MCSWSDGLGRCCQASRWSSRSSCDARPLLGPFDLDTVLYTLPHTYPSHTLTSSQFKHCVPDTRAHTAHTDICIYISRGIPQVWQGTQGTPHAPLASFRYFLVSVMWKAAGQHPLVRIFLATSHRFGLSSPPPLFITNCIIGFPVVVIVCFGTAFFFLSSLSRFFS